jgi:aspartate dehydrogenase
LGILEHIERPAALRVGVVGCGAVGSAVCRAIDSGEVPAELVAVCDSDGARAQEVIWSLKHATRSMTLAGLIASSRLVVEATTPLAASSIALQALDGGCDVLLTNPVAVLRKPELRPTAEARSLAIHVVPALVPGVSEIMAVTHGAQGEAVLRIGLTASEADQAFAVQAAPGPDGVAFRGTPTEAAQAVPRYENLIALFAAAAGPQRGTVEVAIEPPEREPVLTVRTTFSGEGCSGQSVWQQQIGKAAADRTVALCTIAVLKKIVSGLKVG